MGNTQPTTAKTILVADDHESLRVLIRTLLLRAHDCRIVEARDGMEALRIYRDHSIDVAVLDERMPGLTGLGVARVLREDGFAGPIIVFSAFIDAGTEATVERLGLIPLGKSEIVRLSTVIGEALRAD